MSRKQRFSRKDQAALLSLLFLLILGSLIFFIVSCFQGKASAFLSTGISVSAPRASALRVNSTRTARTIINSVAADIPVSDLQAAGTVDPAKANAQSAAQSQGAEGQADAQDPAQQSGEGSSLLAQAYQQILQQAEENKDKPLTFTEVGSDYFTDALFIGDSRTVGLKEYAPFDGATYFCSEGIGTYTILDTTVEIDGYGEIGLESLLTQKQFGKIYLMLGLNELYLEVDDVAGRFGRLVDQIRGWNPDALIFIQANLYVSYGYSVSDPNFNNDRIRELNEKISKKADQRTIFYLDVNPLFEDEWGNLSDEYTGDGAHVYGYLYEEWTDWLKTKGIVVQSIDFPFSDSKQSPDAENGAASGEAADGGGEDSAVSEESVPEDAQPDGQTDTGE
ncbi:MAG: hypothetical protein J6P72_04255 [Firmicutes bacterium]|nr:hypothetical protein [Bacillota bacterium]